MAPFHSILAATDFSEHAAKAASRAAMIAAEHQAELVLAHVTDPSGLAALKEWLGAGLDLDAALSLQAGETLGQLANELAKEQPVRVRTSLCAGSPVLKLAEAAPAADLLVLGARGSHPLLQFELGTTADRLLRKATQPLLVVKSVPAATYCRVLVLADFSSSSEMALRTALQLAPSAAIHLLHAFDLPFEGRLRVAGVREQDIIQYHARARERAVTQLGLLLSNVQADRDRISSSIEQGDIRVQARLAAQDIRPDLIAVGKQGNSLVQDLFLGSVTRTVLAEAQCDVLVIPKGAQPAANP
jgi:nucleotide-binding universal stress UspA family protein